MSVGILHGFAVEKKTNSPTACNCSDRPFRSASRSWQLSMTSRMLWHRLTMTFSWTSTARDIAARNRVTVESVVSINDTVLRKTTEDWRLKKTFRSASLQQTLTILVSGFQLASESLHLKCAEVSWLLWDQLWVLGGSFSSRHLCLQFCAERSNLSLEADKGHWCIEILDV